MRQTLLIFLITSQLSFAQKSPTDNPPSIPGLFMPGTVSTFLNERDMAFSPDGQEIYFTVSTPQSTFQTIVFIKKDSKGQWSQPEIAPFAGKFSDLEPTFNADGSRLFFASNRPLEGDSKKDFDIWMVERNGLQWGTPKNLGAPINTEADEFYPSVSKSGHLYFTAEYKDGTGKEDIYLSQWDTDHFNKPTPLDGGVNSSGYEFNAFIDPDEAFILFTAYGRSDDTGRGDLYVSSKGADGKWSTAVNLKFANSTRLDYCPYVSPDKKGFYFTSERSDLPGSFEQRTSYDQIKKISLSPLNGTGNIYWVSFDQLKVFLK